LVSFDQISNFKQCRHESLSSKRFSRSWSKSQRPVLI
jgi:hypothetical protein